MFFLSIFSYYFSFQVSELLELDVPELEVPEEGAFPEGVEQVNRQTIF